MDPISISTIAGLLLKYGPEVVDKLIAIARKPDPTLDDYAELTAKARKTQDDYIREEMERRQPPT